MFPEIQYEMSEGIFYFISFNWQLHERKLTVNPNLIFYIFQWLWKGISHS
jgi:hypothetical protein